ncbi:hypothetical protein ACLB2K_025832 [Fragaria x ananassa]
MGKRKAKAKPAPKKRMDKLDTVFTCPFCNHGDSVECRIDMKNLIGEAICNICQESFSTTITALTEAIDIYSEWIDECERVNTVDAVDDDGNKNGVIDQELPRAMEALALLQNIMLVLLNWKWVVDALTVLNTIIDGEYSSCEGHILDVLKVQVYSLWLAMVEASSNEVKESLTSSGHFLCLKLGSSWLH